MIVLPGFIDTHRHVWQTQLRTVAADWSLFDYLVHMRSIYSAFYTPEDAYLGNLLGALEAVNAGITTVADHSHLVNSPDHADGLVRGLDESGVRAVYCYGFFVNPKHNPFSQEQSPGWRYEDVLRVLSGRKASSGNRILVGVSPQQPEAIPPEVLHREIRLCRDIGAHAISMHVAMGNYDGGNRVVEKLGAAGLLGPDMLFVHGASLTSGELDAIAAAGAGLSSTPETELQLGMGYPVAFSARGRGVRTSLGIDIVSNYAGDMFAQMRLALQSARALDNHKLAENRQAPRRIRLKVKDALRLATLGGAEALHLEHRIGTIEKGKSADIVMVRTDRIHLSPAPDAIASIVLGASVADVDTVIIDGIVRKRAGKLVGFDLQSLLGRLQDSAERLARDHSTVDSVGIEAVWGQVFPHLA
jgi:cytosine/adenosine deaminase-related metal-dependent hydrolase